MYLKWTRIDVKIFVHAFINIYLNLISVKTIKGRFQIWMQVVNVSYSIERFHVHLNNII